MSGLPSDDPQSLFIQKISPKQWYQAQPLGPLLNVLGYIESKPPGLPAPCHRSRRAGTRHYKYLSTYITLLYIITQSARQNISADTCKISVFVGYVMIVYLYLHAAQVSW